MSPWALRESIFIICGGDNFLLLTSSQEFSTIKVPYCSQAWTQHGIAHSLIVPGCFLPCTTLVCGFTFMLLPHDHRMAASAPPSYLRARQSERCENEGMVLSKVKKKMFLTIHRSLVHISHWPEVCPRPHM